MKNKTVNARRKLLKSLATGGSIAMLPINWSRPAVQSVVLPAHAQMTCGAVYAITNFVTFGFDDDESATICAVVCGDTAQVTFQSFFDREGPASGSDLRRTGNIPTNGTKGIMSVTQTSPSCMQYLSKPKREATLTNLTENSVVYTMFRGQDAGGNLVAVLQRVEQCPTFPPLEWDCTA